MGVYIALTISTICLAAFVKKSDTVQKGVLSRRQVCNWVLLTAIFLLLFAVSSCRRYVGNDYDRYLYFFDLIALGEYVPTEFGFNAVVRLMQFIFGVDTELTILALFAFATILFMVKALYDQSDDFFFSFTLFMLLTYYFQTLNTVRYYLALAAAFYAAKYAMKKQYVKFILIILVVATIHKSALIVIPLYILANRVWKRWQIIAMCVLAVSVLLFGEYYLKLILLVYPSYQETMFLEGGTSIINIMRCIAVLVLALLCYKQAIRGNAQNTFYFNLNILALLLYTCGSFLPEISRIGYYMTIGHVFLIPSLVNSISKRKVRGFFKVAVIAAGVLYLAIFLRKASAHELRIVPYQTWVLQHDVDMTEEIY